VRELRDWANRVPLAFGGTGSAHEIAMQLVDARVGGPALYIRLRVPLNELEGAFGLQVFAGGGSCVTLGFDTAAHAYFTDRRSSSSHLRAGQERHTAARVSDDPLILLEVWIDGCALEVYADGGSVVFTEMVFMPADCMGVELLCNAGNPQSVAVQIRNLLPDQVAA